MATNTSYGLGILKPSWFQRSFTLGRRSKNTFTPNSENGLADTVASIHKTVILKRFLKKEEASDTSSFHLQVKTLGRIRDTASEPLTALAQAKQLFASPEQKNLHADSNQIMRKFQSAKDAFQNGSYKDAKKRFKKILQKQYPERRTIELYLATIYLLQDHAYKAKKYLEGKPKRFAIGDTVSLSQAMYSHVIYLIHKKEAPEKIRGPFLIPQLYEKAEGFSEDETIMAKALCKKFCMSS
ncbi:MAG: hypothetical protein LBC45_05565 [Chlamydiales bacterium]|jgi:hypothetical protein|nr:hypothetical protein [Chlamydiales bacterium]